MGRPKSQKTIEFLGLYEKSPDMSSDFYAERLGISKREVLTIMQNQKKLKTIDKGVSSFSVKQATVKTLYNQGLTMQEIAEKLKCSKQYIAQIVDKLRNTGEIGYRKMIYIQQGTPKKEGVYLVQRNLHGQRFFELLQFDGSYWVTGLHDNPDSIIEFWTDTDNFKK